MVHYVSHLNAATVIALLFPVLIWTVVLAFLWSVITALQEGIRHLQRLHQIPCDSCQYYTGSYHLKCPVHPLTALSEEAIGCDDFEPATGCQPQLCYRHRQTSPTAGEDWRCNR